MVVLRLYAIIDLVASMRTHEHLLDYNKHPAAIKGMLQKSIYRSLGLSAHLGWARLVIDRTKEQIKLPDARSSNTGDNEDDEAHEHENYFSPDPGFSEQR